MGSAGDRHLDRALRREIQPGLKILSPYGAACPRGKKSALVKYPASPERGGVRIAHGSAVGIGGNGKFAGGSNGFIHIHIEFH